MDVNVNGKLIQQVMLVDPVGGVIPASTARVASSGNVADAPAVASLPAVALKTNYLTGVNLASTGATAASVVLATITGLEGDVITLPISVVAGASLANAPLHLTFTPPLKASGPNVAITVTVPALGAGNTNSVANMTGYAL